MGLLRCACRTLQSLLLWTSPPEVWNDGDTARVTLWIFFVNPALNACGAHLHDEYYHSKLKSLASKSKIRQDQAEAVTATQRAALKSRSRRSHCSYVMIARIIPHQLDISHDDVALEMKLSSPFIMQRSSVTVRAARVKEHGLGTLFAATC